MLQLPALVLSANCECPDALRCGQCDKHDGSVLACSARCKSGSTCRLRGDWVCAGVQCRLRVWQHLPVAW